MGIEERKQREKEQMRKQILDAAREIFLEKGYNQTSIRNIADKIEYSPATIYLYFKEKDEIFLELHDQAFAQMFALFRPLEAVRNPFERLVAMGRTYLDFAFSNKDLYDLMFIMNAPMRLSEEGCVWAMGDRVFDTLVQTVRGCQQQGRMQGRDAAHMSFIIWSGLHGMCALHCRNRMSVVYKGKNAMDNDDQKLLKESFESYIEMIEKL